MTKKILTVANGIIEPVAIENEEKQLPPPSLIQAIHPFGSTVLVEMLTKQESVGTKLWIREDSDVGAEQGYVLELGPSLKPEECRLKVGDRVILQGTYVPIMNYDQHPRKRGIVELHNIKAIIEEAKN